MSGHTPGPWACFASESEPGDWGHVEASAGRVAMVLQEDVTPDVACSNARLIAAAPYLLAACKAVLACDTWHDHNGHAYLRVDARSLNDLGAQIAAVVAKAEGC